MNPEKGNFFRRFFQRLLGKKPETPPEAVRDAFESSTTARNTSRKREENNPAVTQGAKQLQKLEENATIANEIIKQPISAESLEKQPALFNLVADILSVNDIDNYHRIEWLKAQLEKLGQIDRAQLVSDQDRSALDKMADNIKRLEDRYRQGDERIEKEHLEVEKKAGGADRSEIVQLQELLDDTNALPAGEDVDKLREHIKQALDYERVYAGSPQKMQEQYTVYDQVAHDIQEVRGARKRTPTTNQAQRFAMEKADEQLDHLLGKFASAIVHGKGMEGGLRRYGNPEVVIQELQHNAEYRDFVFYDILKPILNNARRQNSRDLTSLDMISEMEVFMGAIGKIKDKDGSPTGKKLVTYYTMLKNSIHQTHDMDFYAAHPAQGIDEFTNSTAFFTNSYIDFAFQSPMVALGKRMYEQALLQIREDHGGYIPRKYLEWTASGRNILLDQRVEMLMKRAIENGQLYRIPVDPVTGFQKQDVYGRLMQGKDAREKVDLTALYGGEPPDSKSWRRALGDLEIAAAMKQAKGLALVDLRLLEVLSRSKGTGSYMKTKQPQDHYSFAGPGFGSIPYEGIARHIEPIIHYFSRFPTGLRHVGAFFNIMITDKADWNPDQMRELMELHWNGDNKKLREKFGDAIANRLISMDNPFSFSGMWGTMTGWRVADSTMGWDDWRRERLSTANKLASVGDKFIRQSAEGHGGHGGVEHGNTRNIEGMTKTKVEEHFLTEDDHLRGGDGKTAKQLYNELKKNYRETLLKSGDLESVRVANNPLEFEKRWRTSGMNEIYPGKETSYKSILEKHLEDMKKLHPHLEHHMTELKLKFERAYKSRIWIQAAMRSPLIVAREWQTKYDVAGFNREGKPLRKKIIYDILKLDLDKYPGDREPTKQQLVDEEKVTQLEGDVSSVREIALRENRDLTENDFRTNIKDSDSGKQEVRIRNALRYWEMVKEEMLGPGRTAQDWYRELGIEDADVSDELKPFLAASGMNLDDERLEGLRNHKINWNKIEHISADVHSRGEEGKSIFEPGHGFKSNLLTAKTVDRDWRYLFSTEDMGWEYLNVTALGERNPVRRAGDLGSHVKFNEGLDKLFLDIIKPKLNEEEFHKLMWEMWKAMSGDDGNMSYDACGRIFYTTMMMYRKADWATRLVGIGPFMSMFKKTSLMQILSKSTVHADAFGPNALLRNIHEAESTGYLLASPENPLTGNKDFWTEWNAHSMEEYLNANVNSVIYEMAAMAILAALALILYKALTAKSEEEEGGGGHH